MNQTPTKENDIFSELSFWEGKQESRERDRQRRVF